MARKKADVLAELASHGITDLDPNEHTVAKLEAMLEFVNDDDDEAPSVDDGLDPALVSTVTADDDDDDEDDDEAMDVPTVAASGPGPLDIDSLTDGMDKATADRIAELFGEAWEYDNDPEDLGDGDVPEPYVELIANYHEDTLDAVDRRTGEPLGLDRIVKGQMREVVERARSLGRQVIAFPVIAHNWPQSGRRRQIVVQVQVAPTRTTRDTGRRTARGDRL